MPFFNYLARFLLALVIKPPSIQYCSLFFSIYKALCIVWTVFSRYQNSIDVLYCLTSLEAIPGWLVSLFFFLFNFQWQNLSLYRSRNCVTFFFFFSWSVQMRYICAIHFWKIRTMPLLPNVHAQVLWIKMNYAQVYTINDFSPLHQTIVSVSSMHG